MQPPVDLMASGSEHQSCCHHKRRDKWILDALRRWITNANSPVRGSGGANQADESGVIGWQEGLSNRLKCSRDELWKKKGRSYRLKET